MRLQAASAVLLLVALTPWRVPAAAGPGESRLAVASRQHAEVHRRVGPAVVGLTCSVPTGMRRGSYIGTGALVSKDGLILTSTTVVPPGAYPIRVFVQGQAARLARIVEHDERTETILLRIDGQNHPYIPLGDSRTLRMGETAYTFGSPYRMIELQDKVSFSVGTISGIYEVRSGDYESAYSGLALETDAAVNPGSDGGPLIDAQGRLVGVMTLAYSDNRWLGMAVPIHLIRRRLPSLRKMPVERRARRVNAVTRAFQQAAREVSPSVVEIQVERAGIEGRDEQIALFDHEARQHDIDRRLSQRQPGAVTGVVLDHDGHILTTNYNVEDMPLNIRVRFADGTERDADVVGRDLEHDLAVIRTVGATPAAAQPIEFAEDADLRPGAFLAAVTRSQDGRMTLNRGIVSATGRRHGSAMQTDAMLNYAASGAPILDLQGNVVGLATHIHHDAIWKQNCGVGFFTQASVVRDVVPRLIAGELIQAPRQAFLGIRMAEQQPGDGVVVEKVLPDTAAERAGMQDGDVIVMLAGLETRLWIDLVQQMAQLRPGQTIEVIVRRDGRDVTLVLTLGEQ